MYLKLDCWYEVVSELYCVPVSGTKYKTNVVNNIP